VATRHRFRFDAVQMPLNLMDAHFRSFGRNVLPVLVREGIGVLPAEKRFHLSRQLAGTIGGPRRWFWVRHEL